MTLRPPGDSPLTPEAKLRKLAGLKLTATDDPRKRKTFAALRENLRVTGINNVPIFHDVDDFVVDGNTRVAAMLDLGLTECLAIQLPADWTKADILKFSISCDGIRRVLPLEEMAEKAEAWMAITETTQEAAARELGISPGYLSKALSLLCLPEKLRERAKGLSGSVKTAIASETDSGPAGTSPHLRHHPRTGRQAADAGLGHRVQEAAPRRRQAQARPEALQEARGQAGRPPLEPDAPAGRHHGPDHRGHGSSREEAHQVPRRPARLARFLVFVRGNMLTIHDMLINAALFVCLFDLCMRRETPLFTRISRWLEGGKTYRPHTRYHRRHR